MNKSLLAKSNKGEKLAQILNYIWIFPFTGGLLIVVGLFNPIFTVSFDNSVMSYIWLFGLKIDLGGRLMLPESMVIIGLVFTLLLSFSILFLIFPSINFAFNKKKQDIYSNYWLFGGLLMLMGIIFYLIIDYRTQIYTVVNHLRNVNLYSVEITPIISVYFLSAFLGISGYILSRYIKTHILEE